MIGSGKARAWYFAATLDVLNSSLNKQLRLADYGALRTLLAQEPAASYMDGKSIAAGKR